MEQRRGLGKGLSALIPKSEAGPASAIPASGLTEVPVEQIAPNPRQPRDIMEPAALADAVVALANNEAERRAFGAAARRTIEAKFSLETSTSRIEALFARLASRRERRAA